LIINPYRFAAGGITDPSDITGLALWFDASDSTTLSDTHTLGAGSTPANGSEVKRWDDKAEILADYDFQQATTANAPIYRTAQINGLDVIEFDGATEWMVNNNNWHAIAPQTEGKTVFIVCEPQTGTGVSDGGSVMNLYDAENTGEAGLITCELAYRTNARTWVSTDNCTTNQPNIITLRQENQGVLVDNNLQTVVSMWLNGASVTNDVTSTDGLPVNQTTSTVNMVIGSNTNAASGLWFDGYVCEIVMYDPPLSATDRAAVEAYLANKWGITI